MTTSRDRPLLGAIAPTTIRIPPDVRDALQREANINRRTLSMEIVERLRRSLEQPPESAAEAMNKGESAFEVAEGAAVYRVQPRNDAHRMLLALYDAMGPDKQLALLTVLRR